MRRILEIRSNPANPGSDDLSCGKDMSALFTLYTFRTSGAYSFVAQTFYTPVAPHEVKEIFG